MTNKCTIISQIITLLHVSTLFCHPEGAYNQYFAKLLLLLLLLYYYSKTLIIRQRSVPKKDKIDG